MERPPCRWGLGFDAFREFVIRFDFDCGLLQFLRTVPPDSGDAYPFLVDSRGAPTVAFAVGGEEPMPFAIATEVAESISLRPAMLARLERQGLVRPADRAMQRLAPDLAMRMNGFVNRTGLGGHIHRDVLISAEAGSFDGLGLRYLSRYVVTIDFKNQKAFFKKGNGYDRVDRTDQSGLVIARKNGQLVVDQVRAHSPANDGGFQIGDVILQIDGKPADKVSLFQVRRLLEGEPQTVAITVGREQRVLGRKLALRDYRDLSKEVAHSLAARRLAAKSRSNFPVNLAELDVASSGAPVVVHINLDGVDRPLLVLVDTGASTTFWDAKMRSHLGATLGATSINVPLLPDTAEFIRVPSASLGGVALASESIGILSNLHALNEEFGYDLDGIIGMNFLSNHVVQIDFDAGKFRLLSEVPMNCGQKIAMEYRPTGTPVVAANLGSLVSEWFVVDTGWTVASAVSQRVFRELARSGHIDHVQPVLQRARPDWRGLTGRASAISLGSFRHGPFRVISANVNALGLSYLARYTVTLDFPGWACYLKPGELHERPERTGASGISIIQRDDAYVLRRIDAMGPGAQAGAEVGDVILSVDGHAASGYSLFELRRLLTEPDKTVTLVIQRGQRRMELEIVLRDFLEEQAKHAKDAETR